MLVSDNCPTTLELILHLAEVLLKHHKCIFAETRNQLQKAKTDQVGWRNVFNRKEEEAENLQVQYERERKMREDADTQMREMILTRKKLCEDLEQLQANNAELLVKVQDLDRIKATAEKQQQDLEGAHRRLGELEDVVKAMKTTDKKLEETEAYVKELEAAIIPIVDLIVPQARSAPSQSILDRIKVVPQRVKSAIQSASKVVVTHVLAIIQSRWSLPNINEVADGVPEDCSDQRYEELKAEMTPLAADIIQDLTL